MIYQIGLGWRYFGRKWNYKMWLTKERTLEEKNNREMVNDDEILSKKIYH